MSDEELLAAIDSNTLALNRLVEEVKKTRVSTGYTRLGSSYKYKDIAYKLESFCYADDEVKISIDPVFEDDEEPTSWRVVIESLNGEKVLFDDIRATTDEYQENGFFNINDCVAEWMKAVQARLNVDILTK